MPGPRNRSQSVSPATPPPPPQAQDGNETATATPAAATPAPTHKPKKSLLWAYICCVFGWWFGAHHWYLERNSQAFLYMVSGGGLIAASVLDLLLLPWYVRHANRDWAAEESEPKQGALMALLRFGFYLFVAYFFEAMLKKMAGPLHASAAGTAIGIHVLLLGRGTLAFPSFKSLALVALLCAFVWNTEDDEDPHSPWVTDVRVKVLFCLRALLGSCQGVLPNTTPSVGRRSRLFRFVMFVAAIAITAFGTNYISLSKKETGEVTTLGATLAELGDALWDVGEKAKHMGWQNFARQLWDALVTAFSSNEEETALSALGLVKGEVTMDEIKVAFKKLSRKFHPDAPGGSREKQQEINSAFAVLKNYY
eukprot:TRINITY_DN37991_c0_g1_i1.p1 TRINITY_DN37991_c0_g1~~TRINITY_DN37991_c0_g1_i1.p1  ORF type:complete len:366 (+),score=142.32 TRINITY_DN37991_c0_g1_i1:3-1100(+)